MISALLTAAVAALAHGEIGPGYALGGQQAVALVIDDIGLNIAAFRIKPGMTEEEAIAIVGVPPERRKSRDIETGRTWTGLMWVGAGGQEFRIGCSDGIVKETILGGIGP
jgi:hypothetical protein